MRSSGQVTSQRSNPTSKTVLCTLHWNVALLITPEMWGGKKTFYIYLIKRNHGSQSRHLLQDTAQQWAWFQHHNMLQCYRSSDRSFLFESHFQCAMCEWLGSLSLAMVFLFRFHQTHICFGGSYRRIQIDIALSVESSTFSQSPLADATETFFPGTLCVSQDSSYCFRVFGSFTATLVVSERTEFTPLSKKSTKSPVIW